MNREAPGNRTLQYSWLCQQFVDLGIEGWGEYYKRAHVRKLFQRLDGWIRRRIWSHRYRRWRNPGWKRLHVATLYGEYKLVRLLDLIPSLASRRRWVFVKAACGKSARAVWAAGGG